MTRFVIDYDPDGIPEGCDGNPLPESEAVYAGNEYLRPDGEPMPYAEYCQGPGNPDNHIVLMVTRQDHCACCGEWRTVDVLCGIDFLFTDDWTTGTFPADQLPRGYLGEVCREMLRN